MSIPAFAAAAAYKATETLQQKKSHVTLNPVFKNDRFITTLLTVAPVMALSVLLVIAPAGFTPEILTCSLRTKKVNETGSTCDTFHVADHNFINNYCFSRMAHYEVDEFGNVDLESKTTLRFLKLFPYILLALTTLGAWTGICWEITSIKRIGQAEYLMDGIEEATGELIAGLKAVSNILNKPKKKILQEQNLEKKSIYGSMMSINKAGPEQKQAMRHNRQARASVRQRIASNLTRETSKCQEKPNALEKIDIRIEDEVISLKGDSPQKPPLGTLAIKEVTKNLSSSIYESLEEHWKKNDTRAKFMELEDLMEARAGSSDFLTTIYLNRVNCLIVNIVAGGVLFHWFVYRIFDLNSFNCLLPEYYHYQTSNGEFWQTTRCYFKPLGSWLLVSFLTFTLYCFTFLLQIYFWYISVNKWKKAYTLIQYLPITCAMAEDSLSDLHVLMAKISENDGARKTLSMCDKVLSALNKSEHEKFLLVLLEVIVWGETDEKVDGLVSKILRAK
ncbi:Oidioi.mRNA.OKI2018_I69.PAR.g9193.t1.cds [Oikopleura dioica]|uniref:Oidioi.mRNA.OKI2018_I69.PAR.g9193.t1.cds n=1 Tax=Oikopleura dioica TaxID=34765 RepID=A0ABN7RJB7_OIKDI|nr:Oidioi.mRNA.OKI2018_I69.PAR.g9193.t1.cds [Oikopleura dioica]